MEYKPANTPIKKVGLVGKGVTFDTGGLSIKPSTNMHYMKSDMGGAAAVMGTMEMAAKLKLPIHLFGVVPATDNSVDAKSIKPGDVIGSYDGKTIEVIDTDAEGRLILADGLAYAVKNFQPDVLIDLATLTGSCIRTLGTYAGGLFSNDDNLIGQLMKASQLTGERLWPLPLWDDYKKEIKSDVADVKNFSGNPSAGAITAAKFLEIFIQGHPSWAHMDIAGVAVSDSEYSTQKSATAFGVRLLICYLESLLKPS
jgi:leucyl aminopeptidase